MASTKSKQRRYIGKYKDDETLCPATSLCHYLDKTQNFWFTNEQRAAEFLSCIGLHNPALIDSIANWLKDIIRKLASDGKAKDIQVLSAILAQNRCADLNSILALGNWSGLSKNI
ncbi:hypothetical protein C2G38_2238372 [Gigaspora rosea]|uniref:Uncharacterized protein n=1 Tax=Gigaspora rosea TaxID=44941 RepID=A0A397WD69_9GLOM|nr:hypothetical protein C2G38_2238372 [Gigaspora rosea]CAG8508646.1 22784_t:CDS:1 [Gigaspora rosea]